ncbi:MAG: HAD-IIB family hydrolase [Patescibacteria group bacterium]
MKNFNGTLDLNGKVYKHVFFDVDKTLTRSRSLIEDAMKSALMSLCTVADVTIVSGAKEEQIWKQISNDFIGKVFILAQNGNFALSVDRKDLWKNILSAEEKRQIMDHINLVRQEFKNLFVDVDENDLIQDRGCQITFSFVGHNAELTRKEKFDPTGDLRNKILKEVPFVAPTLEVKVGGTTSFDYFARGKNKGSNIKKLMELFGWKPEECLYIGDALFPGGNDDTVIGVCDTLQVQGPEQTLAAIQKMI